MSFSLLSPTLPYMCVAQTWLAGQTENICTEESPCLKMSQTYTAT